MHLTKATPMQIHVLQYSTVQYSTVGLPTPALLKERGEEVRESDRERGERDINTELR